MEFHVYCFSNGSGVSGKGEPPRRKAWHQTAYMNCNLRQKRDEPAKAGSSVIEFDLPVYSEKLP
jgi:hypothetical protein